MASEQRLILALALFDAFAGAGIVLQNFECWNAPAAIRLRYKPLADM